MVENAKTGVIRANNAQYLTVAIASIPLSLPPSPPQSLFHQRFEKKSGPPRETRILISRAIQTSSSNGLSTVEGGGGGRGITGVQRVKFYRYFLSKTTAR